MESGPSHNWFKKLRPVTQPPPRTFRINARETRQIEIADVTNFINKYFDFFADVVKKMVYKTKIRSNLPIAKATAKKNAMRRSERRETEPFSVQVTEEGNQASGPPTFRSLLTSSESVFGRLPETNERQQPQQPTAPTTNLTASLADEQALTSRRQGLNQTSTRNPPRPPRHPDYANWNRRQMSFTNWPTTTHQDPTLMTNYGFFYTGQFDLVRCYQCGIGLKDWAESYEPLFEHIKRASDCPFLLQLLGPDLLAEHKVNLIPAGVTPTANAARPGTQGAVSTEWSVYNPQVDLACSSQAESSYDEDPAVVYPSPGRDVGNITDTIGNVAIATADPLSTPSAQSVLNVGYARQAVLLAIRELDARGMADYTGEDLLRVLLDKEDRGEALPTDSPTSSMPIGGAEGGFISNDPRVLQSENQRLKRILKCMRCDIRDCNMLFLPCAHHRLCEECSEDVEICPICERQIAEKIRTYMCV